MYDYWEAEADRLEEQRDADARFFSGVVIFLMWVIFFIMAFKS